MAKLKTEHWILLISAAASISITAVMLAVLGFSITTGAYLLVFLVLALILPYSFYRYINQSRIRGMEEQFPLLLKDLADSLRAGLTMPQAVKTAANSDYKGLTKEVKRMSNQMSWGVTFEQVINNLRDKFAESAFISRGLAILLQAYRSGGDISPIMTSVADSTILLQNVEKDRVTTLTEQTTIIYVIQIVFAIILVILFKVLIPLTTTGSFGSAITGAAATSRPDMDYYKMLFFVTIIIQSACNGMVAGVTQSGSIVAGIRHFAIMFAIGLALYVAFILPRSLQVTAVSERYNVVPGQEFTVSGQAMIDDKTVINNEVVISIGNSTYRGLTDFNGEYQVQVYAPETTGQTEGVVVINYEGLNAQTSFTFKVV